MSSVATFADLAAEVLARPPRGGPVRLVAIDGPAGSGKTTFAARLGGALRAGGARVAVVGVDDVRDGWSDLTGWWPGFRSTVLDALREDRPASYRRYDWHAGRYAGERIDVAPVDVLVLDGVGSADAAAGGELTIAVWITADDPEVRLRRLVERDGETMRPQLLRWMPQESAHFVADGTALRADVWVDGAPRVPHDPSTQYVRWRPDRPAGGAGADGVDGVARLGDDPGVHPPTAHTGRAS